MGLFGRWFCRLLLAVSVLFLVLVSRTLWVRRPTNEDECHPNDKDYIDVRRAAIDRLARAIRFETVSVKPGQFNRSALLSMHSFIEQAFPRLHHTRWISREVVNTYSLLFRVQGTDRTLQPYLLAAHLDVVPAPPSGWSVAPFDGVIDDKFIWGRGTLDDKGSLMGLLEMVEFLAERNLQPKRTFYLAFGHDEEVGGHDGAKHIAKLLQERREKFLFILDEGMVVTDGIVDGVQPRLALIGVAEKGMLSLHLSVNISGGHSSVPHAETSISILSQAITRLQQTPHRHWFGHGPEVSMLEVTAPEMNFVNRLVVSNLWLFSPFVSWSFLQKPSTSALVRTTTAVTMVNAGVKANVIPPFAEGIVNHRVHPCDTHEEVIQRDREIIGDSRVNIAISDLLGGSTHPSPISSFSSDAEGYQVVKKALRQVFSNLIVAPGICVGNTDTRHYLNLSDNIYRFRPIVYQQVDVARFHGLNERLAIDNYAKLVNFYVHVVDNADKVEATKKEKISDMHEL